VVAKVDTRRVAVPRRSPATPPVERPNAKVSGR
jgi:hypothetical protein